MKPEQTPAIEVIELTRSFNSTIAVNSINFAVSPQIIFGLLGPNGAGKSTTIKMLTTLLPPTSGTARINSWDIVKDPASVRGSIGYVPQLLSADGDLTGYENMMLSAKIYGLPKSVRIERIQQVLEFMGLSDVSEVLVKKYSGGMIRKLEIAQAFIHKPAVLFLDEPTVGLDPAARQTVWQLIKDLRKQYGTTILMTTHDMEEADRLCNVIAFMHLGQIVAMGTPNELKTALGPAANLQDAFIHYTGTLLQQSGDFRNVKQTRRTIKHLE